MKKYKKSSKKAKIVGLTYDLKTDYVFKDTDPEDANAELDSPITLDNIIDALKSGGYKIVKIGNARNLIKFLNKRSNKVDIIFNIAEGLRGRNRESEVPVILEMMGVPFVGSDGLTLGITLDKYITKKLLVANDIPTPHFFELKSVADLNGAHFEFPMIVKPRCEGTSKGISEKSVVSDMEGLKKRAAWAIKTYDQPALVEKFIGGREFTVAIIGNDPPIALPPVQIRIDGKLDLGNLFYTFSRVHSNSLNYVCPSQISRSLEKKMCDVALKTYETVECRDFGRVDIRVDENDNVYVLEINPLPSLSKEDVFNIAPPVMGTTYEKTVCDILQFALKRYNLD